MVEVSNWIHNNTWNIFLSIYKTVTAMFEYKTEHGKVYKLKNNTLNSIAKKWTLTLLNNVIYNKKI